MQRAIPATLALSLLLGATPAALAQDDDATSDEAATQRAEIPALGVALDLPAEWRVSEVEGERESAVDRDDGTPVMETTAFYANGGNGTWCDMDAYLDMPADSGLEGFAYALVTYMQENEGADVAMMVAEEELPVGPAYRVEAFDQATGRIRGLYLFDGPAREDGTFERYLLTCAAREFGEPFWADVANSVEFFEPVPAEDQVTEGDMATEDETAGPPEETSAAEG